MARLTLSSLLLMILAACGGGTPEPRDEAAATAEAKQKGRDTDKTVFDDLIQTQDRARAVEGVTMAAKAATDAAVEQQTGGEPAGQQD